MEDEVNLKPIRKSVAISLSVAVTSLLALATPAAAGEISTAKSAAEAAQSKTIDIVGGNVLKINKSIASTYHFQPGNVHVHQGDTIVLTNHSDDFHSFSLVDASLLPTTAGDVFNCGAPGTICGAVVADHFPNGFPQGPPAGCPPTLNPTAACIPYIDGGQPSLTPPGLDTVSTLHGPTGEGDSVLIGPGGPPTQMQVTAAPGTTLAFMCVVHAWMQGKIVVGS
jgi:plastocyanin